jgi:hypothetical protein
METGIDRVIRLGELEMLRDAAFLSGDITKAHEFEEAFNQKDLVALRDCATALSEARALLTSGQVDKAASLVAELTDSFTRLTAVPVKARWWEPKEGLEKILDAICDDALSPLLERSPVFDAVSEALRTLRSTLPPLAGEDALTLTFPHVNQLKRDIQCVHALSARGISNSDLALLGKPLSEYVSENAALVLECATRTLMLDISLPLSHFLPAIDAARLLDDVGGKGDSLLQFARAACSAALSGEGGSSAALLALDRLLENPSNKVFVEEFVRNYLETTLGSGHPWGFNSQAIALLFLSNEAERANGLALLSRACFDRAKEEEADVGVDAEDDFGDEWKAGELEESEVGRSLSTVNFEDFDHYDGAIFLRSLLSGTLEAAPLCSFEDDEKALKRHSAPVTVSAARALGIALSGILNPYPLEEESAIDDVVSLVDDFEGKIMLRPTREDVSEPFCLQELLLRGVLQLSSSSDNEVLPLRECIARAVESGTIGVARNVWWASDLEVKLFDQGLSIETQEQCRESASELTESTQVAEERDDAATAKLLSLLRMSPEEARPHVEAWLKTLDARFLPQKPVDEFYALSSSNVTVPASAVREASELLRNRLFDGKIEGVPAVSSLGIGEIESKPVLIVGLEEGDKETCIRVAQILAKLVPVPVKVEVIGRIVLL